MNQKTDNNLIKIKSAFVIKASNDGLIHQPQPQGVIYPAKNKRFFLLRKGKDARIQSEITDIAPSGEIIATNFAPRESEAITTTVDDFTNRILIGSTLLSVDGSDVDLNNADSKDINAVEIDSNRGLYLTKYRFFNFSNVLKEVMTSSKLALAHEV
ncbi:hypothetical protein H6G41_14760 [Tolypothrix sp. FACHB-123]|uniref:hypothetical protein n=1 Tax=Tolypothrix sp. FACHB-123 TaxID=2692868 RepID=UPI001686D87A|nr:hypothetical protein [Tolypothrix sp. FACHB-123]MBD2355863.1 hypothetical protein [Tolypothrix sp. FACHB-123]